MELDATGLALVSLLAATENVELEAALAQKLLVADLAVELRHPVVGR